MTKKKNKRLKRFVALFSLVLVLAFTLVPFSASALSNDFLNFSYLPNANLIDTPSAINTDYQRPFVLSSSDAQKGSFTFTSTAVSTTAQSAVVSVPFKDLLPYTSVGDVLYLSWDVDNPSSYTHLIQFLKGSTYGDFYTMGEALTVTQDILDSYICFYPFAKIDAVGEVCTYFNFRANLGKPLPFEPFSKTVSYVKYLESFYNLAYSDGVSYAESQLHNAYDFFTADNFYEVYLYYFNDKTGENDIVIENAHSEDAYYFPLMHDYAFSDGYTFDSIFFPLRFGAPSDFLGEGWRPVEATLTFFFDPVTAGTMEFTVRVPEYASTEIELFTTIGEFPVASAYCKNDSNQELTYTVSNDDFKLSSETNVIGLSVTFRSNTCISDDGLSWYDRDYFPSFYITSRTREYYNGYLGGYANGYQSGYWDGEIDGVEKEYDRIFTKGYDEGYLDGDIEGYNRGYDGGYNTGFNSGYLDGHNDGFIEGMYGGYNSGYNQGVSDVSGDGVWYDLFSAVVSVPVDTLTSMFNFEVLGVNLSTFFASVITLCCLVAVIRFIL